MKEMTYDQAYKKLEKILDKLQNEEISLDQLTSKVTEATQLIEYCKTKLRTIEVDLKKALE